MILQIKFTRICLKNRKEKHLEPTSGKSSHVAWISIEFVDF